MASPDVLTEQPGISWDIKHVCKPDSRQDSNDSSVVTRDHQHVVEPDSSQDFIWDGCQCWVLLPEPSNNGKVSVHLSILTHLYNADFHQVDFTEVAKECNIVSKGAVRKSPQRQTPSSCTNLDLGSMPVVDTSSRPISTSNRCRCWVLSSDQPRSGYFFQANLDLGSFNDAKHPTLSRPAISDERERVGA